MYFYNRVVLCIMQNEINYGCSLVSKSLPVKKNILVTCLFPVGKNIYCVLLRGR
jgi:hypothetical protein